MKQIKNVSVLYKLRNGEHYQVHSVVIKALETPIADFSELTNAYTAYKQVFNHEDDVFKYQSKMPGTRAIIAADERRSKEYMNLRMIIKSNQNSIDAEIREAAESLMLIADNYKKASQKGYNEATAFVTNFIKDCRKPAYQPAVTKLGLGASVDQLEADNLAFESMYNTRTRWVEQQRLQGNMEQARPPVDKAFKELVFDINALYAANEIGEKNADKRTKLNAIIDEVNAQLDNMIRVIAYRQPSGGSRPDPDPDPHPEPEPGPIVPYHFRASTTLFINGRILAISPTNYEEFADLIDVRMVG
ncbi:DUF6261 family protein, partial [Parabacteroides sp. OttesenSCG-928-G21]|nr:DUF6261 family protein [Parabacteroides sp. OttesenSCG-928-G21]